MSTEQSHSGSAILSATQTTSKPFGELPYLDYAYPEPSNNLSLSEESDVDLEALIPTKYSFNFHLGPATWKAEEIDRVRRKPAPKMPENIAPIAKMPT